MRIGIVGWGLEGQSAFKYFGPEHEYLIVNEEPRDDFPAPSEKIKVQFISAERTPGLTSNVTDLSYLDGLDACDKVIYTPTSYPNLRQRYKSDNDFWPKTTSIWHIFFETVKTKNIIGITGTKGKGTTSTLVYEMLKAAGKKVYLGGNIGKGVLDFVRDVQSDDWVVLEMSNFQLYSLTYSPHIAVCLMIVPEHMDWHPDMDDYVEAKGNLFRHQNPEDVAIYFADNEYSKKIAGYSPGRKIPYFAAPGARVRDDGMIIIGQNEQEIINKTEVKLLGEHNLQNICAALTAVFEALGSLDPSGIFRESGIPRGQPSGTSLVNAVGGSTMVDKAKTVLSSFSGLEHRLELVRVFEGVKYYDDSFATTPETAIVAMQAIQEPKIMILGGHDKGANYEALADEILRSNVKHVVTIGLIGPRIAERLKSHGFNAITEDPKDMDSIVKAARANTSSGDAVLLSTGTSSFGMFKDYKDRGDQFKKAVQELS